MRTIIRVFRYLTTNADDNFKKEIWLFNNAEIIVRRMGLPVDRATIKFGVYIAVRTAL